MAKIKDIKVQYYALPLPGNMVDALHGKHDNFELILAEVLLDNGVTGVGYTYTGGIGGIAVAKLLKVDLAPRFIGAEVGDPMGLNYRMNKSIHYVARGGIASFAISALDIAVWDAKLKVENIALADYFGTRQESVKTYYGGIDLMLSEKELLQNLETQLKKGHEAVKIKLGKENEDEDIARVAAVRKMIGSAPAFAVDANMIWSVEQAKRMANKLEKFDLFWLEEPTDPDNYEGYAEIANSTAIPIAMGENLHLPYEHKLALDYGKVKEIVPDVSNVCGISGFFEVAKLAKERGLKVNSHGAQEIHKNVLGALDNAGYVEFHSFPIHEYINEDVTVSHGLLKPDMSPGVGVSFDLEKIQRCKLN